MNFPPEGASKAAADGRSALAVRNLLVVVLAFTSGYIDALSYLALGRVFTSNMTGNTVLLGLALGQARGLDIARSTLALIGFVVGVTLGSTIVERDTKRVVWPITVSRAFAIEFVVLLTFAVVGFSAHDSPGNLPIYILILLSAVAMGIQGTTVRVLGVSGIVTTHITGTWTSLVTGMTKRLRSSAVDGQSDQATPAPSGSAGLQAAVLVAYILAAIAGGVAVTAWFLDATLVPVITVASVALVSQVRFRKDWQSG